MAEKQPSIISSPSGGYPIEIFPKEFDHKFLCNHCSKILKDPVQSYCGHRFCKTCIESVVSAGEQVQCQSCIREGVDDEEYSMLTANKMFPDNAVKREMSSMESHCINVGCDWKGPFKNYEKHVNECQFKSVACPNCSKPVEASKLQDHLANECPSRKIACKNCNLEIAFKDQEEHNKECPKALIKCELCGKKKIPREKMQQHKDMECANQKIKCPVGCDPVDRGAFPAHCERKVGTHLQWLLQQVASMEHSVQERITATTPREDVQRMAEAINLLQGKVQEQERRMQDMQVVTDRRIEQGPAPNEQDMNSVRSRCQALELKTGTFEGIVTTLHREIERCITALENLERHRVAAEEKIAENERKIRQLERTQSLKDVAISEIDIRVKSLEVTSYDGTLIWKIPDWSRHRRDAVNGKVTSIYSPHFFNGRTGYRLCARLYPNGDGMGKNTHISIFFVVVRGFYDALLSWPFSHRVTFMLLDQNNRDHVIDSFRPDPSSSSFKRPTTDMNIASGCPLFMPLSKLDDTNAAYVKDDVMFIKVIVESTDRRGGTGSGSGTGIISS